MSVFAPASAIIWKTIESYGLDPKPLFSAEGIGAKKPSNPHARIPPGALDRIRAQAIDILQVDTFGLRAGEHTHPSHFGALGYAWLASSTLRSALERLRAYIKLFNDDAEIVIEETADALLVSEYIYNKSLNYAARDDTSMAILVQLCRFNCGRSFRPQKVLIRHPAPDDETPWLEYFGCPVEFGAKVNQFSVPLNMVDRKLMSANAQLALINDQLIARDIARLERGDIITRIRSIITEKLSSGCFSEQCIAEEVQLTVRTMHRKLLKKGTSFTAVLAAVRQETADRYLRDSTLTLTQIAFLLGFSQVSSFSRAYRKWTGTSPSEARKKLAG